MEHLSIYLPTLDKLEPMLPLSLVYRDDFYLPMGAHVFPGEKYRLVHQRARWKIR